MRKGERRKKGEKGGGDMKGKPPLNEKRQTNLHQGIRNQGIISQQLPHIYALPPNFCLVLLDVVCINSSSLST